MEVYWRRIGWTNACSNAEYSQRGAHAASNVDVQEFVVMPHGFDTFEEGLRAGVETIIPQREN